MRLTSYRFDEVVRVLNELLQLDQAPLSELEITAAINIALGSLPDLARRDSGIFNLQVSIKQASQVAKDHLPPEIVAQITEAVRSYLIALPSPRGYKKRQEAVLASQVIFFVCSWLENNGQAKKIAALSKKLRLCKWEDQQNNPEVRLLVKILGRLLVGQILRILTTGISPTEIVKSALTKYGYAICGACNKTTCDCESERGNRQADGTTTGWQSIHETDEATMQHITFPVMQQQMATQYGHRNRGIGFWEALMRWCAESFAEYNRTRMKKILSVENFSFWNVEATEVRDIAVHSKKESQEASEGGDCLAWIGVVANLLCVPVEEIIKSFLGDYAAHVGVEIKFPTDE